jgi:hypothetical protein
MQVMQLQPSLLQHPSQLEDLDLVHQRRVARTQNNDTNDLFPIRTTVDTAASFGSGLADIVGSSLHPPTTWAMLLQSGGSNYSTEMEANTQPLFPDTQPSFESRDHQQLYEPTQTVEPRESNAPTSTQPVAGFSILYPPSTDEVPGEDPFVPESGTGPPVRPKRKRRGKHERYVAAEGKNGEPDKTHIDELVTVIQQVESGIHPSENPAVAHYDGGLPTMDPLDVLSLPRSLPSIGNLHLGDDSSANLGQDGQDRTLLDGMAGIPSSGEQPQFNFEEIIFDEGSDQWNDILLQSGGSQIPMPRYTQTNWQPVNANYQEPVPVLNVQSRSQERIIDTTIGPRKILPAPVPYIPLKRGRKSKEDRARLAQEKARDPVINAPPQPKAKPTPHVCTHEGCDARFQQAQHLRTHIASHEGIKPFKCPFDGCGKIFTQKGNLKVSTPPN